MLRPLPIVLAAASVLAPLLAAREAKACGGFFCSTGPVDQSAERILFEVNDDGTSTAIVEVKYNGSDPGGFSWIIPVPEVPVVDVVPALVLEELDLVAKPTIIRPGLDYSSCDEDSQPSFGSGGGGCSDSPPSAAVDEDDGFSSRRPQPEENAVDVTELPRVGPYDDIVVVSSTNPDELIEWLDANDYVVTEPMKPIIRAYVAEGQKFLAVKLAPDAGVQDIAPIRFTCPSLTPTIPLRLTAIAAEPGMRITVHIVGDGAFLPTNYRSPRIDPDDVRADLWGSRDNYDALIARAVADEGGQAFVLERSGPSEDVLDRLLAINTSNDDEAEAQAWLAALLERRPYFTRLSSRMEGRDMLDDPTFSSTDVPEVSGVIDLSTRPAIDVCADDADLEPACGFAWCGKDARCAVDDGGNEGCACPADRVARQVLSPSSFGAVPSIACQDPLEDTLGGDPRVADACEGFACGEGSTCVTVNGFPTCRCEDGAAAFVDVNRPGGVKCRAPATTFETSRLFAGSTSSIVRPVACAASRTRTPVVELTALATIILVARRRRRSSARSAPR